MKQKLRSRLKNKINDLSLSEIKNKSIRIAEKLFNLPEWKRNNTILIFFSMEREVQTDRIIKKAREDGKTLAFPKMYGKEIRFHIVRDKDMHSLSLHPYGIREPLSSFPEYIPSQTKRAMLITPGLGFTLEGLRLGRGKGYYDRYIDKYRDYLDIVAVAFGCQIVDSIPADKFDQSIPKIIYS